MVLAAGAGTRLRPLTYETPKPMVPVVNRPVLHHVLDNLQRHGVAETVINLHTRPELIRRYCSDGSRWGMKIRYSREADLLGTAGAVKKMEKVFRDCAFFVLSGDGLSDIHLTDLLHFHKTRKALATIVLKPMDHRFDYGVVLTKANRQVRKFVEKPSWSEVFSNEVNTGIYLLEPEVLRYIPKNRPYDFGNELWPALVKKGLPIYGYTMSGYWCDVGNLSEYRKSQWDALDGKIQIRIPGREIREKIWVDERTRIPPKVRLKAPCVIGQGAILHPNCVIGPYTVVGDFSEIGSGAVLKNCILWNRVRVGRNVHLSNCIIGENGSVQEDISVYEAAVLNIRQ